MKMTMRMFSAVSVLFLFIAFQGCDFSTHPNNVNRFALKSYSLFPFENISNWWKYTEANGNNLAIYVLDTISDDKAMYFKISFQEKNRDTTVDWFKRSNSGIEYSTSLSGPYDLFLPAEFNSTKGTFESAAGSISYTYCDSIKVGRLVAFKNAMRLEYSMRMLHGFDEIDFADSIGIISLVDRSGRFPVTYVLDSARIGGAVMKF